MPTRVSQMILGVSQRPLTLILLQKYRDTNGRRIVIQIGGVHATLCQEEGILLKRYRDRNGRCIAILFKRIGVRGRVDSPDDWEFPLTWLFSNNWLFANFTRKRSSALFYSLFALFCGLRLRSFACICVFLRTTAFRTTAFGNCRNESKIAMGRRSLRAKIVKQFMWHKGGSKMGFSSSARRGPKVGSEWVSGPFFTKSTSKPTSDPLLGHFRPMTESPFLTHLCATSIV